MQNRPVIRPTYDSEHYRARAQAYARDALHEPDPEIRIVLELAVEKCRRKAEEAAA